MNSRTFCRLILAAVMAVCIWCAPAQPAWGQAGRTKLIDLNTYNGPALAELKEMEQFVGPLVKDYMSLMLDIFATVMSGDPDAQIKAYTDMQAKFEADNSLSADTKAEFSQKIRVLLHKAKTKKQLGTVDDPATLEKQVKAAMPSFLARLRQFDAKMYDGLKPRLFRIADKDPAVATQLGITYPAMELATYIILGSYTDPNSLPDSKLMKLSDEVDLYIKKTQQ